MGGTSYTRRNDLIINYLRCMDANNSDVAPECKTCGDEGTVWKVDQDPRNGQGGNWERCICQVEISEALEPDEIKN